METGSLLAASKTVQRATDEQSPFKMDEKKRLPRFDSVRAAGSVAPSAAETLFSDAPEGGTHAAPETTVSGPLASTSVIEEVGKSKSLRHALFGQRTKDRAAKAAEQFGVGLQQGELKLDQVKVVRNDLSETDFELKAPAASAVVNSAAKVQPKGLGATAMGWLSAKMSSLGRRGK